MVKKAWAKTTRTYSRKQRQRRPSYRLRQSTGAAVGGSRQAGEPATAGEAVAMLAEAVEMALLPALAAAQHAMRPALF